jgi:hypothetical protein
VWCLPVLDQIEFNEPVLAETDAILLKSSFTAFPLIHEVYPAALKKFQHSSGLKRSQISPIALMR